MIVGETAKVLNLYLEPMRIKSVLVIFRLSLFALNRSDPTDSDISVILLDSLQQRYFSHVYVNFATHTGNFLTILSYLSGLIASLVVISTILASFWTSKQRICLVVLSNHRHIDMCFKIVRVLSISERFPGLFRSPF